MSTDGATATNQSSGVSATATNRSSVVSATATTRVLTPTPFDEFPPITPHRAGTDDAKIPWLLVRADPHPPADATVPATVFTYPRNGSATSAVYAYWVGAPYNVSIIPTIGDGPTVRSADSCPQSRVVGTTDLPLAYLHRIIIYAAWARHMADESFRMEALMHHEFPKVAAQRLSALNDQLALHLRFEQADEARRTVDAMEELLPSVPAALPAARFNRARVLCLQRDVDGALIALEQAHAAGFNDWSAILLEDNLRALHAVPDVPPRFFALMRSMLEASPFLSLSPRVDAYGELVRWLARHGLLQEDLARAALGETRARAPSIGDMVV